MFFVFKQKTAYELRIRDWSSDVCSSDLHGKAPVEQALVMRPVGGAVGGALPQGGAVVNVLADQDAVIAGEPHGDAGEGVGGGQAPVLAARPEERRVGNE